MKTREVVKELIGILIEASARSPHSPRNKLIDLIDRVHQDNKPFQLTPDDVGKFFRTRAGKKVVLINYDEKKLPPYFSAVTDYDNRINEHHPNGRCWGAYSRAWDIIGYWED